MLKSLNIVNYALIENLEIEFEDGFSVITGETGAGKSIILGALAMILGSRADLNILRDKSRKCIVEGVFDNGILPLQKFFTENDLDYDTQTIIRREILPSGKSRAFINDTPVTLKLLSLLGNSFVNIHSQHETLQLSNASFQLSVLDDFINQPTLLNNYEDVYENYNSLSKRLNQLIELNNQAIKDEDYLTYQLEELTNADLNSEDFTELQSRVKYLEHAEEIKLAFANAESILNNEENSLTDNLSQLIKVIGNIQSYLPDMKELVQRLESINIDLKDIQSEIESQNLDDNFDANELQLHTEKLNTVNSLMHKHHVQTIDELITVRDEYDEKLQGISSSGEEIELLKTELDVVEKKLAENATELHDARVSGCDDLSLAVLEILKQLGMKDAGFFTRIEKVKEYSNTGIDKVQFMFNANLGSAPGEISKIASGGELSRLMLAIKSLINRKQMLPTVIFDEIDAGVSGDIAGKVGSIIRSMAKNHQVISITHLPQIASKAHHHYKVLKYTTDNKTITTIEKLSDEGRVEELAKIISSEKVTSKALDVARELMNEN